MSQVGVTSRPHTGSQSLVDRLPQIPHPLSRLGNPSGMELCGAGSRGGSGRPLASENQAGAYYLGSARRTPASAGGRMSRASMMRRSMPEGVRVDAIPEGVEVMAGDPSKTRLPIFGKY